MIVAFHFRVDPDRHGSVYGWAIQQLFFQNVLALGGDDLHMEIFVGDLLTRAHDSESARETILHGLLGYNPRKWATVDPGEFANAMFSGRIYVLAVEGLPRRVQDHLDHQFRRDASYLGAMEVDPAFRVH